MKLEEAKAIVEMTGGRTYDGGGNADTGFGTQTGGGQQLDPKVWQDYLSGQATDEELYLLVAGGYITYTEAAGYAQKRDATPKSGNDPTAGLYPYNPATGQYSAYPGSSPIGNTAVEGGHPTNYYVDPTSGILYDANGKALPQYLQKALGGIGGGGGSGVSNANFQAQLGYDYATLAQRAKEFEQQQALAEQQARMGNVAQRAQGGLSLADLQRGLANDQYQRALNPGNYPAYLAASAGTTPGAGSPIEQLLGKGVQIQAPEGGNPLTDPRFQNLMGELYGYARPQSLQTVYDIMNQNGGQLPQAFYDYTHTQNPNVPAHAQGGTQMLNEPVIGVGLHSGQPKFLAGEAGQEKLTFTPVHSHQEQGKMPVPHEHMMGDLSHEHTGPLSQPTFKGYAAGGDAYTPAQGTNISAGKALQALGYVPQNVIQQLMQGNAPTPGSLGEEWYNRMPVSLQQLLNSGIQAQVGGTGLEDYLQRLQQYQMPGLSNASMIGASFQ